jgi:hypothetical protein
MSNAVEKWLLGEKLEFGLVACFRILLCSFVYDETEKGFKAFRTISNMTDIWKEFIHLSSLSYDRSKASSKTNSPYSAIQSFLFQMRVPSPFLKVIQ